MILTGDELSAWLRARAGKLNASRCGDAFAKTRNGWAKSRETLIREILSERLTGETVRQFVNDAMTWGIEHEAEALAEYEASTGVMVRQNGESVTHPKIHDLRATPDAFVDDDGLLEAKCPTSVTHVGYLQDRVVPEAYKPQMLAQLACTGRKWCDFISFDPRIRQEPLRLFVRRFEPTAYEIAEFEDMALEFIAEVDRAWNLLTTGELLPAA